MALTLPHLRKPTPLTVLVLGVWTCLVLFFLAAILTINQSHWWYLGALVACCGLACWLLDAALEAARDEGYDEGITACNDSGHILTADAWDFPENDDAFTLANEPTIELPDA